MACGGIPWRGATQFDVIDKTEVGISFQARPNSVFPQYLCHYSMVGTLPGTSEASNFDGHEDTGREDDDEVTDFSTVLDTKLFE